MSNYKENKKINHKGEVEPAVRGALEPTVRGYTKRRFFFPSSTFTNAIRLCG
jgi:hypothetical protein